MRNKASKEINTKHTKCITSLFFFLDFIF